MLIDLDPYGDKILNFEDINNLIVICEYIKEKYADEIQQFAEELQYLCEMAIKQQKNIIAAGD